MEMRAKIDRNETNNYALNKLKALNISFNAKLYSALSLIAVAGIIKKQIPNEAIETTSFIALTAAVGYYIHKLFKEQLNNKTSSGLQKNEDFIAQLQNSVQLLEEEILKKNEIILGFQNSIDKSEEYEILNTSQHQKSLQQASINLQEQKQLVIQLQNTIKNLELLIEVLPGIAVFRINSDGTYKNANQYFANMIGKKPEDIVGKTDKELFPFLPDALHDRLLAANRHTLLNFQPNKLQNTNPIIEETIALPLHDGEHILLLKKYPFIENGENVMLGIAIDVSELIEQQVELEQQKINAEKMAEKAEKARDIEKNFLANMSHELRTPLNGIMGFSQLLLQKETDQSKQFKLKLIYEQGEHLLALVNDILDIARAEAGKLDLEHRPISIKKIISTIAEVQGHSIAKKDANVPICIDESIQKIPDIVLGDDKRIMQVLNNLIGNAIKFTHKGVITISCSNIEDIGHNKKIEISVSDTGIGIPEEKQSVVFEKFTQVDGSSSREYGGTGLGLPLAKQISHLMKGDITLKSEYGKGSVFTFSFIVEKDMETSIEPESTASLNNSIEMLSNKSIVIVEDIASNKQLMVDYFKTNGANPICFSSGEAALKFFENGTADLVIMDLKLPGINGFDTTKQLKKTHPGLPIIAVTANVSSEQKAKAYDLGIGFVEKPVLIDKLLKTINCHLSQ